MQAVAIAATVGAGLNGGVFFAFSTFIMTALRRLRPRDGLIAMQQINRDAPSPWFMTALFGTAVLSVVAAIDGLGTERVAAASSYLVAIVLTMAYHVPRNNALDGVDPDALEAEATWLRYARDWTRWNHLRTFACLLSAALFAVSLVRG